VIGKPIAIPLDSYHILVWRFVRTPVKDCN